MISETLKPVKELNEDEMGLIQWIKFKGWFIFDLPYFIKERQFKNGLELGAKGGRSMYRVLKTNKDIHLTGIDLWIPMEGSAYKKNAQNETKCRRKLHRFSNRTTLIKGDAKEIAEEIEDGTFDFIFYDLQCSSMSDFHRDMIQRWLPKIRKGGLLIGRDFRDFRESIYRLGFEERDIHQCTIGKRVSERLEYIVVR